MIGWPCAICGHSEAFHDTADGTGRLRAGTMYCDDRYSAPCSCTGFQRFKNTGKQVHHMIPCFICMNTASVIRYSKWFCSDLCGVIFNRSMMRDRWRRDI